MPLEISLPSRMVDRFFQERWRLAPFPQASPDRILFCSFCVLFPVSETDSSLKAHGYDRGNGNDQNEDDNARQGRPEPRVKAFPNAYFAGVGANGYAPPDTNIAVGPNHIVETVNTRYAIYDKNGAPLVGPKSLSSLWT